VQSPRGRFGALTSGALLWGTRSDQWLRNEGLPTPNSTGNLFVGPGGEVLATSPRGVFRLEGDLTVKQPQINFFGLKVPLPQKGGRFVDLTRNLQLATPLSTALDPNTGDVAFCDTQVLLVCHRNDEGRYEVRKQIDLDDERPALVAFAGPTLMLARSDGLVRLYDPKSLEVRHEFQPQGNNAPRSTAVSSDGRYAAVAFHNRELCLYDTKAQQESSASIGGQGEISALAFTPERLLVVDDLTRMTEYELGSWKVLAKRAPEMGVAESIYRYAIWPIYTIFPKPSELDQTISYLLTDEESTQLGPARQDLSAARVKLDVWGPVWSNLAFLCVMLGFASLYVHRKDF
jgi:hypothetical protein